MVVIAAAVDAVAVVVVVVAPEQRTKSNIKRTIENTKRRNDLKNIIHNRSKQLSDDTGKVISGFVIKIGSKPVACSHSLKNHHEEE